MHRLHAGKGRSPVPHIGFNPLAAFLLDAAMTAAIFGIVVAIEFITGLFSLLAALTW